MSDRTWRLGLIAVSLAAVFLHFDAINNGMVFDDHFAVETNNVLLDGFNLPKIMSSNFWGDNDDFSIAAWRPLVTLTYALNFAVHGMDAAGYHLVNLILHGLVTLLVGLLAESSGVSRFGALLAAALFAVHPIHVEAVVPIVGRADLMLGAFGIGSLLLWEKKRFVAALLCLTAALYSKEMGVIVAAVLVWRSLTKDGFPLKPKGILWVSPLIVVGLWLVSRWMVLGDLGEQRVGFLENPLANADVGPRFWTAGTLYTKLLGLMIFPRTLLRDYSFAVIVPHSGPSAMSIIGWLLLLSSMVAIVAAARRFSALSAAASLWVFGFLLVSHLGPTLPMIFAERVFYLPSAGLFVGFIRFVEWNLKAQVSRRVGYSILVIALSALGVRSVLRVGDWKDDQTLTQVSLRDAPDNIKNIVLSVSLLRPNGVLSDEASERLLLRALALKDDHPLPHVEAAKFYVVTNRPKEALSHIEKADRFAPLFSETYSVKCAYAARYDLPLAIDACEKAVTTKPNNPNNWSFLAIALDRMGNPSAAEKAFRQALQKMDPPRADILLNYGVFLAGRNRYEPAAKLFHAVLDINPDDKEAAAYLAEIENMKANERQPSR